MNRTKATAVIAGLMLIPALAACGGNDKKDPGVADEQAQALMPHGTPKPGVPVMPTRGPHGGPALAPPGYGYMGYYVQKGDWFFPKKDDSGHPWPKIKQNPDPDGPPVTADFVAGQLLEMSFDHGGYAAFCWDAISGAGDKNYNTIIAMGKKYAPYIKLTHKDINAALYDEEYVNDWCVAPKINPETGDVLKDGYGHWIWKKSSHVHKMRFYHAPAYQG